MVTCIANQNQSTTSRGPVFPHRETTKSKLMYINGLMVTKNKTRMIARNAPRLSSSRSLSSSHFFSRISSFTCLPGPTQ